MHPHLLQFRGLRWTFKTFRYSVLLELQKPVQHNQFSMFSLVLSQNTYFNPITAQAWLKILGDLFLFASRK